MKITGEVVIDTLLLTFDTDQFRPEQIEKMRAGMIRVASSLIDDTIGADNDLPAPAAVIALQELVGRTGAAILKVLEERKAART